MLFIKYENRIKLTRFLRIKYKPQIYSLRATEDTGSTLSLVYIIIFMSLEISFFIEEMAVPHGMTNMNKGIDKWLLTTCL